MNSRAALRAAFCFLMGLGSLDVWWAQELAPRKTVQTIEVYRGAPVRSAVETLRERYNLAITYEDPVYACSCDLADMTHVRKAPGPRIIVPKRQQFNFKYFEVDGKPEEDTTSLLRRLLTEFTSQGGPVFEVRERTLPKGTQWNVIAVKARGSFGDFENQPDILGAPIFIRKEKRTMSEFLEEMLQQLRTETGYRVVLGTVATNIFMGKAELGADNESARDILARLFGNFGNGMVWDLNYDPEGEGRYVLNITWTSSPKLPSLDAYKLSPAPRVQPVGPVHIPLAAVLHQMNSQHGRMDLQSKLAKAGYYTGEPSGKWDDKTIAALKKYQAANNLPVTGTLNPETIWKLELDVVEPQPQP